MVRQRRVMAQRQLIYIEKLEKDVTYVLLRT